MNDVELRLESYAYQALGQVRPSFKGLPRAKADRLAAGLLEAFTALHGVPGCGEVMVPFARVWVRGRL